MKALNLNQLQQMTATELSNLLKGVGLSADTSESRHSLIRRASEKLNVGHDINTMTTAQLKTYITNRGKVANQRLVELEKRGKTEGGAYQYLTSRLPNRDELMTKSASGHLKFNLKTRGKSRNELLQQATAIERFNESLSSTIRGSKKLYNQGIETFNKKYADKLGRVLTQTEFEKLVTLEGWEHLKQLATSERVFDVIKTVGFDKAIEIFDDNSNIREWAEIDRIIDNIPPNDNGSDFMEYNGEELPF